MAQKPNLIMETNITGFYLVPDVLVEKYGCVTANVWGGVRRYTQMSKGVCNASIEVVAASVGLSRRTVMDHINLLCKGGYLEDTTPTLKCHPHSYIDTGLVSIESKSKVRYEQKHHTLNTDDQSPEDLYNGQFLSSNSNLTVVTLQYDYEYEKG